MQKITPNSEYSYWKSTKNVAGNMGKYLVSNISYRNVGTNLSRISPLLISGALMYAMPTVSGSEDGFLCFTLCMSACTAGTGGAFIPACVAACTATCATNPV